MSKYDELKRLAEAAVGTNWKAGNFYGKPFIPAYQVVADTEDGPCVILEGNKNFLQQAEANCAYAAAANPAAILELITENERLAEKAEKFAVIERVMEMLECDEREGGIWTACSLLLISSAHKLNSDRSVVDQEGVTIAGEQLGDWRVTVERVKEVSHV